MIKVALVGCGRIAVRHAELLGGGQIPGACLVAVCDLVHSKAQSLGNKYSVPYFQDMHEMMRSIDIDLVSVLTESGNHAQNTIDLAKYKKHILVEKPMALKLSDADAMIKSCQENNIQLFVVKQNRYNLPVLKLKEALNQGRFGKITMGTVRVRWSRDQAYYDQASWRGTWAMDGGVLANQASHHVDLLEWMLGDVKSVFARSITSLAKIQAEDTAAVVLNFESGALGIIEATTAARPKDLEGSLSILGQYGTVEIGGFAVNSMKTWQFTDTIPEDKLVISNYSSNPPDVYGFGHK